MIFSFCKCTVYVYLTHLLVFMLIVEGTMTTLDSSINEETEFFPVESEKVSTAGGGDFSKYKLLLWLHI